MGLIAQSRIDIKNIVENANDFGVPMTLLAPDYGETAVINGLHSKTHLQIDTDGNPVNAKNAHISFHENATGIGDYPIRNAAGEVDLKDHKVTVADSTGLNITYKIEDTYPNETTGLIVCLLGDFQA